MSEAIETKESLEKARPNKDVQEYVDAVFDMLTFNMALMNFEHNCIHHDDHNACDLVSGLKDAKESADKAYEQARMKITPK
jgi:hypothetical protein